MPNKSCKTCKYLRVKPDKLGRRVVRKNESYLCDAPLPTLKIPDSIRLSWQFKWPPDRRYMQGVEGNECDTWEALEVKVPA